MLDFRHHAVGSCPVGSSFPVKTFLDIMAEGIDPNRRKATRSPICSQIDALVKRDVPDGLVLLGPRPNGTVRVVRALPEEARAQLGIVERKGHGWPSPLQIARTILEDHDDPELLRRTLTEPEWLFVRQVFIAHLLSHSVFTFGAGRHLDGQKLWREWRLVPAESRALFGERFDAALNAFAGLTPNGEAVLDHNAPALARALLIDGELVKWLLSEVGKPTRNGKANGGASDV